MKRRKLSKKEQRALQQVKEKKEKRILAMVGVGVLLIIVGFYAVNLFAAYKKENAYKQYTGQHVPSEVVCMVSDMIKDKPVEAYTINNEIYRGCCSKCEYKLRNNIDNTQFATDPFSGKTVRKSRAYIVLEPNVGNVVSYFETEDNYNEFLKKNHKK